MRRYLPYVAVFMSGSFVGGIAVFFALTWISAQEEPLASGYCRIIRTGVTASLGYDKERKRLYADGTVLSREFENATVDMPVRCVIVAFARGELTFGDTHEDLTPDAITFREFDGKQPPYLWWKAKE